MAKEFDVTFADADNDVRTTLGHRFRDLKPGNVLLGGMRDEGGGMKDEFNPSTQSIHSHPNKI